MKLSELVVTTGVRRYRKALLSAARKGLKAVRLVGERGDYSIAVQTGKRLVICSPSFTVKRMAESWNARKTGQALPSRVLSKAA